MSYPFGRIKLRSTGRASNLTTPTTDFSPENPKSFQADVKAVKLDPNDALWLIVTTVEGGEAPNRRRLSPHRSQEEESKDQGEGQAETVRLKIQLLPSSVIHTRIRTEVSLLATLELTASPVASMILILESVKKEYIYWFALWGRWRWHWPAKHWRPGWPKNVSAKHKVNNCCS